MKWEMHTYYNNEVNGRRTVCTAREGVAMTEEEFRRTFKQMEGKEHSLKSPVGLYASCSACHRSFNGMENDWKSFKFCPNCAERVEGIDETSKLWSDTAKKFV